MEKRSHTVVRKRRSKILRAYMKHFENTCKPDCIAKVVIGVLKFRNIEMPKNCFGTKILCLSSFIPCCMTSKYAGRCRF